jgi:glycosyltransferase involved in cell wall biosynthesis
MFYRGGIGAVLAVYEKYFPVFKAIGTHRHISGIGKIVYFGKNYLRFIWTMISDPKIRVIHIHGSYGISVIRKALIAFTGKSIFRKKLIYQIHSSEYPQKYDLAPAYQKKMIDFLFRKADLVGCLTRNWQLLYQKKFGLSNTVVIPNMIHPPDFEASSRIIPTQGQPVQLAFLGLIHEKKGIFEMVQMVADNKAEFTGKLIIHIGGIGKVDELNELIIRNGLEDIVKFRGWFGESNKATLYKEVDAFILPSHNEGLPVVILEAMSYGLPIIATRVGGIPEIMEHEVNGFLFEKGDVVAMKTAIRAYINNHDLMRTHGRNSLELVKNYFPGQVLPQIAAVYHRLLDKNPGA